jgi:hypothetical protein
VVVVVEKMGVQQIKQEMSVALVAVEMAVMILPLELQEVQILAAAVVAADRHLTHSSQVVRVLL